jgi:hypothetical protein
MGSLLGDCSLPITDAKSKRDHFVVAFFVTGVGAQFAATMIGTPEGN